MLLSHTDVQKEDSFGILPKLCVCIWTLVDKTTQGCDGYYCSYTETLFETLCNCTGWNETPYCGDWTCTQVCFLKRIMDSRKRWDYAKIGEHFHYRTDCHRRICTWRLVYHLRGQRPERPSSPSPAGVGRSCLVASNIQCFSNHRGGGGDQSLFTPNSDVLQLQ